MSCGTSETECAGPFLEDEPQQPWSCRNARLELSLFQWCPETLHRGSPGLRMRDPIALRVSIHGAEESGIAQKTAETDWQGPVHDYGCINHVKQLFGSLN